MNHNGASSQNQQHSMNPTSSWPSTNDVPSNLVIHMGIEPFEDLFILQAGKFMVCICNIQLLRDMPLQPEPLRQDLGFLRRLLPRCAPPIVLQKPLLIQEGLVAKHVHKAIGDGGSQPRDPRRQELGTHGKGVALDLPHINVL
uniref:Uncharacterized protein n=1 Tax=Triticum urartu TaxID=4572 RepID=A0A8R7TRZ5_TRIUA